MRVFFSASISRTQKLRPITKDIVDYIESLGHEILTKELVDPAWTANPLWDKKLSPEQIYKSAQDRLDKAEVLITECTIPSFGAGWWIDKAIAQKKPILSMHYGLSEDNAPLMLRGRAKEINLQMYTEEDFQFVLKRFFKDLT